MKIAIFYNLRFGGAKRVVMEQVMGLRKRGHFVDVYTTDKFHDDFDPGIHANNEFRYDFSPLSIKFPVIGKIKADCDIFFSLKKLHRKIAKDIDEGGYNIALVHVDYLTQSPFILKYLKTKNVYFCLEPLRIAYEYSLRITNEIKGINKIYEIVTREIRKRIDRSNGREADEILAISYFDREYIIHAYDRYPKISYLGIDINKFKSKNVKKKNQILFVAEKLPIYGYDFAVKAIETIPKKIRPTLKVLSWTENNSKRLTDEEVVSLYAESIATFSLSKYDTFGLIPLESLACSTPVIAFNVAGYRETMLDGKTGYLVDFDIKEIAKKTTYLITHKKIASRMGAAGRKWIEKNWTLEKQIDNLEKIIFDFVAR